MLSFVVGLHQNLTFQLAPASRRSTSAQQVNSSCGPRSLGSAASQCALPIDSRRDHHKTNNNNNNTEASRTHNETYAGKQNKLIHVLSLLRREELLLLLLLLLLLALLGYPDQCRLTAAARRRRLECQLLAARRKAVRRTVTRAQLGQHLRRCCSTERRGERGVVRRFTFIAR